MQNNNDRKQMIQQGFDTVAAGYDHPSLSFFPEMHDRQGWWKCWQCIMYRKYGSRATQEQLSRSSEAVWQ